MVGRRRVERALRSVSVNSGGDLPLSHANGPSDRRAVCVLPSQSLRLRSATHDPIFIGIQEVSGRERDAGKAQGATSLARAAFPASHAATLLMARTPSGISTDLDRVPHTAIHDQPGPALFLCASAASRPPTSAERSDPPPSTTSTRPAPASPGPGATSAVVLEHPQRLDRPAELSNQHRHSPRKIGVGDPHDFGPNASHRSAV